MAGGPTLLPRSAGSALWALDSLAFAVVFLSLNHLIGGRDLPQTPEESSKFLMGVAACYVLWFIPLGLYFALCINAMSRAFSSYRAFVANIPLLQHARYVDWALYGVAFGALWIGFVYFSDGARPAGAPGETVVDTVVGFWLGYALVFLPLSLVAARAWSALKRR